MKEADRKYYFYYFYVVRENGLGWSHPHWGKTCVDHNGQINLRAKQKYEVLSATDALKERKNIPIIIKWSVEKFFPTN